MQSVTAGKGQQAIIAPGRGPVGRLKGDSCRGLPRSGHSWGATCIHHNNHSCLCLKGLYVCVCVCVSDSFHPKEVGVSGFLFLS